MRFRRPLMFGGSKEEEEEAEQTYTEKVLEVEAANLIAYWPMDEAAGAVADNAEGTAARDGAYTGVTLGQSVSPFTCPLFDGSSDALDIYSASLNTAWPGSAGTLFLWIKVSGAGVWTDSKARHLYRIRVDGSNFVGIQKRTTDNGMLYEFDGGGTYDQIIVGSVSTTAWMLTSLTWDVNAGASGELKAYHNGAQVGSTQTGLGTWAGNIDSRYCAIGSGGSTPASVWDGWLAHGAIWSKALSAEQLLSLYNDAGV